MFVARSAFCSGIELSTKHNEPGACLVGLLELSYMVNNRGYLVIYLLLSYYLASILGSNILA